MAASELLATGSSVNANSTDLDVAAGSPVTVSLKGMVTGEYAEVHTALKNDAGGYQVLAEFPLSSARPVLTISGPGTYRFTRKVGTCGVYRA